LEGALGAKTLWVLARLLAPPFSPNAEAAVAQAIIKARVNLMVMEGIRTVFVVVVVLLYLFVDTIDPREDRREREADPQIRSLLLAIPENEDLMRTNQF
jgi:hypothetical protein